MLKTEIKEDVLDLSKCFDGKEGFVTCETSVHKDDISELEQFIKDNTKIKYGKWVFMECDTCVEYNGEGYAHVSLERFDTVAKIEKSSNHIKTVC